MEHQFAFLLFEISLVLTAAKIGGLMARSVRLPVVLGELFAGVIVGNMGLLGITFFEWVRTDSALAMLAELGVIILMFEVGVESTVGELRTVGWSATLVAIAGVVAPFVIGFAVTRFFFSALGFWVDIFVGATLCATSVGISARVLKDLGKVQSPEGRTILGAAIVDDVLGLIILAVIMGLIGSLGSGAQVEAALGGKVAAIVAKAFGFFAVGLFLGILFSKRLYRLAARLELKGMLLTLSLTLCFAFACLADAFGLAVIVGAFTAGLVLEPEHSKIFSGQEKDNLEQLIVPLSTVFVPLFFFHVGAQLDLNVLFSVETLALGLALSMAAVAGKVACAGAVFQRAQTVDRWSVALGMVPRGEVGLIFAGMGANLKLGDTPLLSPATYAALVLMVFVTTAIAPPLLARRLFVSKQHRRPA